MSFTPRLTILFAVALACAACGSPDPVAPATPPPEPTPAPWVAPEFEGRPLVEELASVDRTIELALAKARANPTDWIAIQTAVGALLSRAKLSGDYNDYARAERALTRAFRVAPEGSGPVSVRASLNFTLHRLDRVGPDLDRLEALPATIRPRPRELALRRGALALEQGNYAFARALLQGSVDAKRTVPSASTLALWFWRTGDFEVAQTLYEEAFGLYHGRDSQPIAWLHLQLGLLDLDRGRWDDAMIHYRAASAAFPGWYLVDEHIAEILTLRGEVAGAVEIYERLITETGIPEFMDAMAGIERGRGNEPAARRWILRAGDAYEAQLSQFPEAAYGHALDHYLEFGEPTLAVDLATKNHTLRPNGEAKVRLAEALLRVDRAADALPLVEEALASPYRSADLHGVASGVFAATGDDGRAAEQRAAALAINPHAFK